MGPLVSSRSIVGREQPRAALEAALAAAAGGRPGLTLLSGEAGIGKTRLATALEERARERGFAVLHGEAIEFGGEELAYAPLVAALRDAPDEWVAEALSELPEEGRGALAAVLPRLPAAPGPIGQGRIYELLLGLLGRLAGDHAPLLLVLEDVHWADCSTHEFLAFFARNVREERIALLATYRSDDLPDALRRLVAELARRRAIARIELAPLSEEEVAQQLEAIAGEPVTRALAADLHARAGGNPFFVEELFAARRTAGLPDSVAEAVRARVERLAGDARRALSLVAAAGGRLDHGSLAPPAALHPALDAGLLVRERDDRGVAFRHGLIGEVLYARLLPAERVALHREIAAALPLDAPAAQRALQCHRAGLSAEALVASVEAGLHAADAHAFAEAGAHFERALDLWDPDVRLPLDRVALLAHAAQAARATGAHERAVARCREAIAETPDPRCAALLYERLGEYHFWDDEAALRCYDRALELLGESPSPERSRVLAAQGHALMGLRRWHEARERCEAALDAGAGPRITLGVVLAFLGDAETGEAHLRRALELSASGEDSARAHLHLGELLRVRGDHAGAFATMVEGERVAARLGLRGSFGSFMYVNGAADLVRLGHWDEAAQRLAEAGRMDLGVTAAAMRLATAAQLHALRGETEAARAALARVPKAALPSEFVAPLGAARATLALVEGDPAGARAQVEVALAAVGDAHDPLYTPELYSLGARAEAALAERERRAPQADLLDGLDAVLALAAPPDALAHRAVARAELGGAGWEAVARAWDALAEPYPAAYARVRVAETALPGDRASAATALAAAHATAVALGAAPLREEIEALARRARLPLVTAAAPVAGAGDGSGLTPRETDVLRALAEGLSNREIAELLFISQKTVATHLAHIFGKLDVHTRVQAAGRAQRLGVLERST